MTKPASTPASVPGFMAAQLVGASLGLAAVIALFPRPVEVTADTAAIDPATADLRSTARSTQ